MPKYTSSLSFIGGMFFACGFALGLNPILIPVLQQTLDVSSFQSYWIVAASFVPFLLWGYPAQAAIQRFGYRRTMSLSFLLFGVSFVTYLLAARYLSLPLFLAASFLSGTANAFLQATINPYVTILGPIESAAKRISVMGICNKLAWPLPSLFLVWLVGKEVGRLTTTDLYLPFYILTGIVCLMAVVCLLFPLPDITRTDSANEQLVIEESDYAAGKTSIWQFPHLWLGAIALFLYVGVETVSLSTAVDYANNLGLPNADLYAWIAPVGMVVGYVCGVLFIPKYISQATALKLCSGVAIVGSLLIPLLPAQWSIYALALLAIGCSLMWPAIWPLASTDLGRFSAQGNSLLTMSIAGGAVLPTVFGMLNDYHHHAAQQAGETLVGTNQASYWICLPCFVLIWLYGVWGYKIRKP